MEEDNSETRKRQRDENSADDCHKDSKEARKNNVEATMSDAENCDLIRAVRGDKKPCCFRLEAIFLPKFENENRTDQVIRKRIKELVASGCGYAEASLKHSGSLLLWSGGQRFYSKNSTNNKFSWVGEILLRQHFYRAASLLKQKQTNDDNDGNVERLFKSCSDYVEKHRLTLSFECVTSVLGDHGATPNRDYLILTAVADRTRQHKPFYSTPELLRFAQKFVLPHNDTWVFASQSAIDGLFKYYDESRETGLANSTVKALNEASDVTISSMYPHESVHSNILEGFVIRYVSYSDSSLSKEEYLESLKAISARAEVISKQIPTDAPLCFELATKQGAESVPTELSIDVRTVHSTKIETQSDAKGNAKDQFADDLHKVLLQSGQRPTVQKIAGPVSKAVQELLPTYANNMLEEDAAETDAETQEIAKVISTVAALGGKVEYSLFREQTPATPNGRYLCMVHVYHDKTFQKYRRVQEKGNGVMDLFRGFCFEICIGNGGGPNQIANQQRDTAKPRPPLSSSSSSTAELDEESGLILKMKFLPYMVRTFGCRNGMRSLRQGGPIQFNDFIDNLFARWGMSSTAHERWVPYLYAWGEYAHACLTGSEFAAESEIPVLSSPPLSESCYLSHLMYFEDLHSNNKLLIRKSGVPSLQQETPGKVFKGLVVVIAITDEAARTAAETIARDWLDGAQLLQGGTDSLSHQKMIKYSTRSVGGRVCWGAAAALKLRNIRGLPEADKKCISLVLVGCSEDEAEGLLLPQKEKRKFLGMSSSWRKTTCGAVIDLPSSLLDASHTNDGSVAEANSKVWAISDSMMEIDERPGLLVFFPASIPGCGKSTLLDSNGTTRLQAATTAIEESMKNSKELRAVQVLSGDKLQKKVKYWKQVHEQRLLKTSTITLADKNVPRSTWDQVARICAQTNGRAVPAIPDRFAVFVTTFVDGARASDAPNQVRPVKHHYPFSLLYLAVCMARVLSRERHGHVGKLDPSTPHACMVVCKFFSLYRGLSAEDFLEALRLSTAKAGAVMVSSPVEVPFFDKDKAVTLPSDLKDVLLEALQAQSGLDSKNSDVERESENPYFAGLETRLRNCINTHKQLLIEATVDEDTSRKTLVGQVAQSLLEVEGLESSSKGFINIVAVDVGRKSIHEILRKCMGVDSDCLNGRLKDDSYEDDEYKGQGYIANTHLTMAHYSQLPQDSMRAQFESILGQEVDVSITGLVWNQSIGALSVTVAGTTHQGGEVPKPLNSFSHVTVWHAKGVSPAESNKLPGLLASGDAQRVALPEAVVLKGKISFWSLNQH